MGGDQPHPPSPPLPFDHLRVLGSVASSNSRRTWSWFPVGRGPWAKTGRKRQGRAAAGRGGGFKAPAGAAAPTGPTPGPALQGLGRGLRLAPRCLPTSLPRVPPPFQKWSDLSGGQAWPEEAQEAVCRLGRSPPKSGLPRPLFTERTVGVRNLSGEEPNAPCLPRLPHAAAPHRAPAQPLCAHTGRALGTEARIPSSLGMEGAFWPRLRAASNLGGRQPGDKDTGPLGQWLQEHFGQPAPLPAKPAAKGNILASNKPPTSLLPLPLLHSRTSAPAAWGTPANCPSSGLCPPPTHPQPQRRAAQGSEHGLALAWPSALHQAAPLPSWPPPCHTPWLHSPGPPGPNGR